MSDGGEVDRFCVSDKPHDYSCEYYMASGGEAGEWEDVPSAAQKGSEWEDVPTAPQNAKSEWVDVPKPTDDSEWADVGATSDESGKYSTTEQQIKTGLEGLAQGVAGPAATWAETHLFDINPEDIKGRAEANPWIHGGAEAVALTAGLLTGVGEAGLIAKGAGAVAKAANLSKAGAFALKGLIEGASFAGSDEITKAMLSQPGADPEAPASAALLHVGAAGLMGGLTGGVFSLGEGMIGKGISSPEGKKMADKAEAWLIKIGESEYPLELLGLKDKIVGGISTPIAGAAGTAAAMKGGPAVGMMTYDAVKKVISKPISRIVDKANPYITDAAIKSILTHDVSGLPNAVHYARQIARGAKKAADGVEAIFKSGGSQLFPPALDSQKEFLKEFIGGGQINQQIQNSMSERPDGFANGGEVPSKNDNFSTIFPEQNTILNAAKGRISNYLNSIRPLQHQPKLAFDKEPSQVQKQRSYDKAIDFAVNPMSILNHVNKGDLTPEHMQHFKALYPDAHKYLSQQMTKRITQAQLKDEKPPYGKRQAMSLFLGADLDSTLTPQSIATIQGLYAAKQMQQQQAAPKQKRGTAPLSKSSNPYLTDGQARIRREQNSKA